MGNSDITEEYTFGCCHRRKYSDGQELWAFYNTKVPDVHISYFINKLADGRWFVEYQLSDVKTNQLLKFFANGPSLKVAIQKLRKSVKVRSNLAVVGGNNLK